MVQPRRHGSGTLKYATLCPLPSGLRPPKPCRWLFFCPAVLPHLLSQLWGPRDSPNFGGSPAPQAPSPDMSASLPSSTGWPKAWPNTLGSGLFSQTSSWSQADVTSRGRGGDGPGASGLPLSLARPTLWPQTGVCALGHSLDSDLVPSSCTGPADEKKMEGASCGRHLGSQEEAGPGTPGKQWNLDTHSHTNERSHSPVSQGSGVAGKLWALQRQEKVVGGIP